MLFLFRLLSLLPLRLLHAIGWLIGQLAYLCSPVLRQRYRDNMQQAGIAFDKARPAIGHAGKMLAELPKIWLAKPQPVIIGEHAKKLLDSVKHSPQGVLFFTPHIGCFELSAQAVSIYWDGARGPLTVLYRPSRNPKIAQWMKTVRDRFGVQAVPTDLSGVRTMLKSLRKGGSVGLLPDQVPPYGLGIWSPFFGKPAYTMTMAAKLIEQTNPIVMIARCERLPKGAGYELFMEMLELDPTVGTTRLVRQVNEAMERQIAIKPEQYMWGYDRYKRPRGMPADEAIAFPSDAEPTGHTSAEVQGEDNFKKEAQK